MRPYSASAVRTRCPHCCSSATSARTAEARPPASQISFATASISAAVRAATTTAAPSEANFRAIARPIPRPPPVMTATFPAKSIGTSAALRVMYTIHHEAHTALSERRYLEGVAYPLAATGHVHLGVSPSGAARHVEGSEGFARLHDVYTTASQRETAPENRFLKSVLIDSDILIEVSRARDSAILARWDQLSPADTALLCSPVTVAELWHGARPQEHATLSALFAVLHCVPIDLK